MATPGMQAHGTIRLVVEDLVPVVLVSDQGADMDKGAQVVGPVSEREDRFLGVEVEHEEVTGLIVDDEHPHDQQGRHERDQGVDLTVEDQGVVLPQDNSQTVVDPVLGFDERKD